MEKIKDIREKVNLDSSKIEEIVQDIIQPYCEELDRYVDFIKSTLIVIMTILKSNARE